MLKTCLREEQVSDFEKNEEIELQIPFYYNIYLVVLVVGFKLKKSSSQSSYP